MEKNFRQDVYDAVKKIPAGKVLSYGMVAVLSGHRGASRAVGTALHNNPDQSQTPCHRVVSAKGNLACHFAFGGEKMQQRLLENEGVRVENGKVDMQIYVWNGK